MSDATGPAAAAYRRLREELRAAELLASAAGVLSWDQETMMPPAGTALRAEQLAALSSLVHERRTQPRIGEWIAECEADPALASDPEAGANLREIRRDYQRAALLPGALVHEIAQTTALAQQAWKEARERDDFAAFAPWLDKVIGLSRAKAECWSDTPAGQYDALLGEYEPGAREAELEVVFADLRARLAPLAAAIAERGTPPGGAVQRGGIPTERQARFNARVLERIGFDLRAGRLDISTHPFCQGVGPGDTRLTTRYREDHFADALSSSLHEGGHGLYEQGLPKAEHLGQPLAEAASLGIHESQSRLWENQVGRSRAFWEWALPLAREAFGPELGDVTVDEVYAAVNRVEPNLIRVDSDEATYNLHIMLRFDLERALLRGDLPVRDLPEAWNARIRADLGLTVPDDRRGCLQDIHWSMGAIGYFPTYTLGNLYAAQFWDAAERELGDLRPRVRRGEFEPLRHWLRRNIHVHGRRYTAAELCERVTGAPLSAEHFLGYLDAKLRPLYGLA
jgi:carboxypeptidase Taq